MSFRVNGVRRAVLSLVVACAGCSAGLPTAPDPAQEVLFHTSFVNHAWGFQSSGWYVDRAGHVWRMSPPLLWEPEVSRLSAGEEPAAVYVGADLEAEYREARDSLLLVLDQHEVREMARLVHAAAGGAYSRPRQAGADGGGTVAGALLYDPGADVYRRIVLSMRGDLTVVNESTAARLLESWLRDVARRIAAGS